MDLNGLDTFRNERSSISVKIPENTTKVKEKELGRPKKDASALEALADEVVDAKR
jgi:hypothetical protein